MAHRRVYIYLLDYVWYFNVFLIFQKLPYPKSILFIVGNEFCERFSYYGMKGKNIFYQKVVQGANTVL